MPEATIEQFLQVTTPRSEGVPLAAPREQKDRDAFDGHLRQAGEAVEPRFEDLQSGPAEFQNREEPLTAAVVEVEQDPSPQNTEDDSYQGKFEEEVSTVSIDATTKGLEPPVIAPVVSIAESLPSDVKPEGVEPSADLAAQRSVDGKAEEIAASLARGDKLIDTETAEVTATLVDEEVEPLESKILTTEAVGKEVKESEPPSPEIAKKVQKEAEGFLTIPAESETAAAPAAATNQATAEGSLEGSPAVEQAARAPKENRTDRPDGAREEATQSVAATSRAESEEFGKPIAAVTPVELSGSGENGADRSSEEVATVKPASGEGGRSEGLLTSLDRLQRSTLSTADRSNPTAEGRELPRIDAARFVNRVSRAFQAAQERGGTLQLRLSPPELGSVRLELSVNQGVLTASMETETAAARHLLLENLPALRERLAEQNIRIDQFDVDVRRDGSGDQASDFENMQEQNQQQNNQPAPLATGNAIAGEEAPLEIIPIGPISDDAGINLVV